MQNIFDSNFWLAVVLQRITVKLCRCDLVIGEVSFPKQVFRDFFSNCVCVLKTYVAISSVTKHVGGDSSEITCASEQLVFVNVPLGVRRCALELSDRSLWKNLFPLISLISEKRSHPSLLLAFLNIGSLPFTQCFFN